MTDGLDETVGLTVRLNGQVTGFGAAARQLVALDRAWAFAVSVEAYQRGYQDTWARQTQYAPRPSGFRFERNSPTVVELWQSIDGPSIVAGGFAAFVYVVNNVEKISTIPDRISIARTSAMLERRKLENQLDELASSDETILIEPPELPPVAALGEAQESVTLIPLDRDQAIADVTQHLQRLDRLATLRANLEQDLALLEERARTVQRDLERIEPEVTHQRGVSAWRPKRRRSL